MIETVHESQGVVPRQPIAPESVRSGAGAVTGFLVFVALLIICFAHPLFSLARMSFHSSLYSHIFLIPLISLYLVWLKRRELTMPTEPSRHLAFLPSLAALLTLLGYWLVRASGWEPRTNDYLAVMTFSFILLFAGGCLLFWGRDIVRTLAFPISLLIFMIPFPGFLLNGIETVLQHGSAAAANAFFVLSGMPVFRQGLEFQLPGFAMQVAPECSGIHSTLVLFITSLLAGYLLLRRRSSRAILVLAVIPLAMLRNGFRIFVIGQLCVRISPDMIHSYIHRRGGPIFFVLSLVPFFLVLAFLRWRDVRDRQGKGF